MRRTVVRIGGKAVATLGRGKTSVTVPARALPSAAFTVTLDATAIDGTRLSGTRRYAACRDGGRATRTTPLRRKASRKAVRRG